MQYLGVHYDMKYTPVLDPGFIPFGVWMKNYQEGAAVPLAIAVERDKGHISVRHTRIHGTPEMRDADYRYVERIVKFLLYSIGGFRVYICGCSELAQKLSRAYKPDGERAFDFDFVQKLYERDLEVIDLPYEKAPAANEDPMPIGGHLDGCRIGFDAGGSDRKVSAVIDGKCVYSEEVVWFPKVTADPDYHYDGIVAALKSAAAHLPRVDAVGVSSAGVYINNRTMNASLFLKVPKDLFDAKVKDIYIRAITDTFGDVPFEVVNDGDVSALAGTMSLGEPNVLGIAMGTSEAVGYVDGEGRITGWLNELAFVPVDCHPDAMEDEWSHDIGCGVKYFSQDAVIKLAPRAGIELDESLPPAEKLKVVQRLMAEDSAAAADVYSTIGTYLGHTLAYYYDLYHCKHVLLLGRVMSGKGGDIVLAEAKRVLADEYPELTGELFPTLPDEKFRRVGQSAAAASLPELKK